VALSAGRLALCLASGFALSLTEDHQPFAGRAALLLGAYFCFAVAVQWRLRRAQPSQRFVEFGHVADVVWAAALTGFTDGPAGPYYSFFLFTVVAGAYRFGLRGATITAAASVAVLAAQAAVLGWLDLLPLDFPTVQLLVVRSGTLMFGGALIGWLAQSEFQRRMELAMVANILQRIRADSGFPAALAAVSADIYRLYSATGLLVLLHDLTSGDVHLWEYDASDSKMLLSQIPPSQRAGYLFSSPGSAWQARAASDGGNSGRLAALGPDGGWLPEQAWTIPAAIAAQHRAPAIVGVDLALTREWAARILLLRNVPFSAEQLAFHKGLLDQVTPALLALYSVRRLRSQIGVNERARLSRELHDGPLQSLAGVRLRISSLLHRVTPSVAIELESLARALSEEELATRHLLNSLRPVIVPPDGLVVHLATIVERFRRETGLNAHFHGEAPAPDLPARTCHELARVLQEALVNIRKHSGASNVVVRFQRGAENWRLIIDNDGQPFSFTGRWTLADLEATRRGPVVLKERVREMGADMVIESSQPQGVRLDILLPRRLPGDSVFL
jgi:signal transduction histidine kinase